MTRVGAPPHRRRWPAAVATVGGTVLAVAAILSVPTWLSRTASEGPSVPQPPSPTGPATPGTTTWHPIQCPVGEPPTCAAPVLIDHAGVVMYSLRGRRLQVGAGTTATPSTSLTLPASRQDRWVLVGAERAGADSALMVMLDRGEALVVPPGRLTLLSVRGHRRLTVSVADQGRPRAGEVLRIEEYAPR